VPALFPKALDELPATSNSAAMTFAMFSKSHYHKPSDDLALPLDYPSAANFARFIAEVVRHVANADDPPRWNPGDFFGERFGGNRKSR
jgi:hypothetical protein